MLGRQIGSLLSWRLHFSGEKRQQIKYRDERLYELLINHNMCYEGNKQGLRQAVREEAAAVQWVLPDPVLVPACQSPGAFSVPFCCKIRLLVLSSKESPWATGAFCLYVQRATSNCS